MTYVEVELGLRTRNSETSDTGLREHSDVGAVNSLSLSRQSKEKGHPSRRVGCLCAMEHIFNDTAMQGRTLASNRQANAIKASHGPRVSPQSQAKKRVKRTMENPKGSPKEPQGAIQVSRSSGNVSSDGTGFVSLRRR